MHCTDDRGNRVARLPQRQLSDVPGMGSPIPSEARAHIIADGRRIQYSREVVIATVLANLGYVAWAVAWFFVVPTLFKLFRPPPMFGVLGPITLALPMPLVIWIGVRAGRQKTARIIVKHGYCASCGYSLANLTAADDGCTVCPECGSAWRIPTAKDA